jgi:hypothetical protein
MRSYLQALTEKNYWNKVGAALGLISGSMVVLTVVAALLTAIGVGPTGVTICCSALLVLTLAGGVFFTFMGSVVNPCRTIRNFIDVVKFNAMAGLFMPILTMAVLGLLLLTRIGGDSSSTFRGALHRFGRLA